MEREGDAKTAAAIRELAPADHPAAFGEADHQRLKRAGFDLPRLRQMIARALGESGSQAKFDAKLATIGLRLRTGDRKAIPIVEADDGTLLGSLARLTGCAKLHLNRDVRRDRCGSGSWGRRSIRSGRRAKAGLDHAQRQVLYAQTHHTRAKHALQDEQRKFQADQAQHQAGLIERKAQAEARIATAQVARRFVERNPRSASWRADYLMRIAASIQNARTERQLSAGPDLPLDWDLVPVLDLWGKPYLLPQRVWFERGSAATPVVGKNGPQGVTEGQSWVITRPAPILLTSEAPGPSQAVCRRGGGPASRSPVKARADARPAPPADGLDRPPRGRLMLSKRSGIALHQARAGSAALRNRC